MRLDRSTQPATITDLRGLGAKSTIRGKRNQARNRATIAISIAVIAAGAILAAAN